MITTLLLQVITMFLLSGIGYLMFRTGKISMEGSRSLGNILIYLSLPCVIINGFLIERTPQHLWGLLYSAAAALVILLLSIVISAFFFRDNAIASFAAAFSNPGFFGVPLIIASLSSDAVFYIASFIAFLNLFQWTYGVAIITRKPGGQETLGQAMKRLLPGPAALLKAPFMIAILIGLFFFLTRLPMPGILSKCIGFLKDLNTPLAMFTVGAYLSQVDLRAMLQKKSLYLVSLIRLLVIPLAAILVLFAVPAEMTELRLAILISIACPVGSNVAVYAQLHNKDYPYAVETVVMSTIFSILTIPSMVGLAQFLWSI